jgi:hypothetical protein
MKRIALFALPIAVALTAMAWPLARHDVGGVCALMTPARMLENPDLASEYAQALRSGDADEVARVRAKLREIRAVHGCEGDVALPSRVPEGDAPALPPGHPPVGDRAGPSWPMFDAPRTLSI